LRADPHRRGARGPATLTCSAAPNPRPRGWGGPSLLGWAHSVESEDGLRRRRSFPAHDRISFA
jgi:hypothetical protein